MRRSRSTLACCLSSAGLLAGAAGAAPTVRVVPAGPGARLLLDGKLITFFRVPNNGLSAGDRAGRAAERLRRLIGAGLTPGQIEIRSRAHGPDETLWDVYAAGELLMVATPQEAAERHEEARETAARWALNLRTALSN